MSEQTPRQRSGGPSRRESGFSAFWRGVVYTLNSPARWIAESMERRSRRARMAAPRRSLLERIGIVFWWPVHIFLIAFHYIWGGLRWWLRETNARFLLQGLPAIVVALGAGAVTAVAYLTPIERIVHRYQRVASSSFQDGANNYSEFLKSKIASYEDEALVDFQRARICYERLAILQGDLPETRFRLALCEDNIARIRMAKDDVPYVTPARVQSLLDELAPESERSGYGPAHLWKAKKVAQEKHDDVQAAQMRFERHLNRALSSQGLSDAERLEAHSLLAQYYARQPSKLDELLVHLEPIVSSQPETRLVLAQALLRKGQRDRGRTEAGLARDYYERRVRENPDDDDARIRQAQALLLLEDFEAAQALLAKGIRPNNTARMKAALAQLYGVWLETLTRNPNSSPQQQLILLQETLKLDPSNSVALKTLNALTKRSGPDAEKARTLMQGLLASGVVPATLHLLLGMDAWTAGDFVAARRHLEQAQRQDKQLPEVANNLAWLYANVEPKDLERALALADAVVAASPNTPQFRDTRGQILAKMGRPMDALADLEFALPQMSTDPALHLALEDVYRKLDMPDIADQHQRIAELLKKQLAARQSGAAAPSATTAAAPAAEKPQAEPKPEKPAAPVEAAPAKSAAAPPSPKTDAAPATKAP